MRLARKIMLLIPVCSLGLMVACQPTGPGDVHTAQTTYSNQGTISADMTRPSTPQPTLLPATSTSIPAETTTATRLVPGILHEGTFIFHPEYSPNDLSEVMLDFEQQEFDPAIRGNDIRMDLASGANPIILVRPINGAAGAYLKNVKLEADFDLNRYYGDCLQIAGGFLHGTEPINYPGDLFCYITNNRRLVDFVVERITGTIGNWDVEISYIVWNKELK